ncbi:NifB/NifX family molybdenum-iron cluster-binding protein [Tolumonas lignilytica]|uniref:NifB/NifX family molybdenum-iron cluster-binding protein n=1 Tax=Tolumonas lignilytica TaxID=1283284 RepID=UPI000465F7ED|nr:NifB/NifX family molybdenum-iron cluster-binding protein [Tolumonas lignilytica]
MITAIPMNEDRIANHFSKADHFVFVNENGDVLSRMVNPALNANCSGKNALLTLLQAENTQQIFVRNIGERILGKLLENQFAVFQVNSNRQNISELVTADTNNFMQMTSPSQGRPSTNYEAKHANGGCGCEHDGHEKQHACCGSKDPSQEQVHQHGAGRCCQKTDKQTTDHHGKGRCCH